LNGTAHAFGPRKYDSGDTGTIMPLADYAKFYEMLLNGGVGPATGERVLSPLGIACARAPLFQSK
jgi:CubicO group peptidase (beta-lactamase class C family)